MNTLTIKPPKGLSLKKAKIALKNLNFIIIEEEDDAKMTKEEFFAKIDRARAGKKVKMSREEMTKLLLED